MTRVLPLLLLSLSAWGADPACRRDGPTVVCTEEGFKTLTDLTVEYKGAAAKAQLQLGACEAKRDSLQAALDATPKPQPPSLRKPIIGAAIAALGAAALATAVAVDMEPQVRLGVGLSGLAVVTTGFVVVILP